jgi:hypothetical protein
VPEPDPSQRDDPVEGGALDEDVDVPGEERPPTSDDPVEGGALESAES